MSASPSGLSNGQTPTPNGGPPRYTRKKKPADPLRPRKQPVKRPLPPLRGSAAKPNGVFAPGRPPNQIPLNGLAPAHDGRIAPQKSISGIVAAPGGWTNPPTGDYQEFPLYTSMKALREDLRYHVARFSSKKDIDPSDQDKFTRPVLLHRRDPKQPPPGKDMKDEDMTADGPVDSKERERQEILRGEKEKQKAADLAQIAPTGNNASAMAAKRNQAFRNEKTTQVFRLDKTAEQKKASDLRYEEALPWHLEDADNKNTWVGNYEAALSDTNVIFLVEGQRFLMIPVEKWYKFTAKAQFKTMTLEEVEAQMNKKYVAPRWMGDKSAEGKAQDTRGGGGGSHRLFTVKSESNTFKNSTKRETEDMDDLDFAEDDLFQDDDEQVTMEPDNDEESKDAQERIKREQLGANVFDQANEADIDMEFVKEEKEAEEQKKLSKGVKKMLKKRERNHIYDSDSDHPYSESSEDDTSDEEKLNEQDKKKEEEAKAKAKEDAKLASGTSSKGTNTPSGRPKHSDPLKKKSLKRPGSPNLSESSGNESTRKKKQKQRHASQAASVTSAPGSRQISPAPSGSGNGRKSSIVKLSVNSSKLSDIQSAPPNPSPTGAMSDGEATGGEMSDGGKKPKIMLRLGGSPTGSRAGSPAPAHSAVGSRAGSPANQAQILSGGSPAVSPGAGPIQPHEIVAALPTDGIKIGDLMKIFNKRVGDVKGQTTKKEFIKLVKENAAFGVDKLLRPK